MIFLGEATQNMSTEWISITTSNRNHKISTTSNINEHKKISVSNHIGPIEGIIVTQDK